MRLSTSSTGCFRARKPLGQYGMRMLRFISVLAAVAAMSLVGVCSAHVSNASPSEGAATGSCSFVLTPPKVVQVSASSMVLATLKPGPCTRDVLPNMSVVCLSIEGESSPGQCGNRSGPEPALIYYPYRPGATYVASGRGCADVFEHSRDGSVGPTNTICQTFGPTSFTL